MKVSKMDFKNVLVKISLCVFMFFSLESKAQPPAPVLSEYTLLERDQLRIDIIRNEYTSLIYKINSCIKNGDKYQSYCQDMNELLFYVNFYLNDFNNKYPVNSKMSFEQETKFEENLMNEFSNIEKYNNKFKEILKKYNFISN